MIAQEKVFANKLLADFDGVEYLQVSKGDSLLHDFKYNVIDYSEDWNLLMSVCKKVNSISMANFSHVEQFTILKYLQYISNSVIATYSKEDCFIALVNFIKFYNSL